MAHQSVGPSVGRSISQAKIQPLEPRSSLWSQDPASFAKIQPLEARSSLFSQNPASGAKPRYGLWSQAKIWPQEPTFGHWGPYHEPTFGNYKFTPVILLLNVGFRRPTLNILRPTSCILRLQAVRGITMSNILHSYLATELRFKLLRLSYFATELMF